MGGSLGVTKVQFLATNPLKTLRRLQKCTALLARFRQSATCSTSGIAVERDDDAPAGRAWR